MRCRSCGHHRDAHHADAGGGAVRAHDCSVCGCTRFKAPDLAAREARLRTWVVEVAFFCKNRWITKEVRVKAMGHAGAVMKAVREAKPLALRPRQRVAQVRVTLTPVPKRKGGGE